MKGNYNRFIQLAGMSAAGCALVLSGCTSTEGSIPFDGPTSAASRSAGTEDSTPTLKPDIKLLSKYVSSGPKAKDTKYLCGVEVTAGGYTTTCGSSDDIKSMQQHETDNSKVVGSILYSPCYTDPTTGDIKLMNFDTNGDRDQDKEKQQLDMFKNNVLDVRKYPDAEVDGVACSQEFGTTPAIIKYGANTEGLVDLTDAVH